MLRGSYFENLIKVFYSNLRIIVDGNLHTEVNSTKITVTASNRMSVANLEYEITIAKWH